ncbi:hypothetical protein AVEN_150105-1 [Araneus ventricosus]|uniref:Uncharacterized protein n=1 Tax=Araneus ventricosus TaxID=182803 RepID=A0A4Y2DGD3_ARAVE|nr:hypothetical protein AVEN_150105-1 [Araneus ventricosus]
MVNPTLKFDITFIVEVNWDISIVMDTLMLFHRLCIAKQSDDDLKAFFKFELSPFPISLFTGEGMRKGTKSSLYTSFTPITEDVKPEVSWLMVVIYCTKLCGDDIPHLVVQSNTPGWVGFRC